MKNRDEMVESLFQRREQYLTAQKRKRKMIVRVGATVCCACLTAVIGIGLWQKGLIHHPPDIAPEPTVNDNSAPQITEPPITQTHIESPSALSKPDGPVIWGTEFGDSMVIKDVRWNGKTIAQSLYDALEDPQNDGAMFAIHASFSMDKSFVYDGKTISQYESEYQAEDRYIQKLYGLLKEGDCLKYGEVLYQTGTPDGEKWAQSLYEETIAEYGEEFLATYLVNGEFLQEKLGEDLAQYEERTALSAYKTAYQAFWAHAYEEAKKKLQVYSEWGWDQSFMVIYATAEQFAAMPELEYVSGYCMAYPQYKLMVSAPSADDLS